MGNSTSVLSNFDVESSCKNTEVNCEVTFSSAGEAVLALGNVTRGNFGSNEDIAGKGTTIAFLLPTFGVLISSFIVIISLLNASVPDNKPLVLGYLDKILPRPHSRNQHPLAGPPRPQNRPRRAASPLTSPEFSSYSLGGRRHFGAEPHVSQVSPFQAVHYPPPNQMSSWDVQSSPHGEAGPSMPPGKPHTTSLADQSPLSPALSNGGEPHSSYQFCLISISPPWPTAETWYEVFEAAIFCIADSQVLLSMALFAYFGLIGRCETSQYHFQIGISLALLGCTSFLLSLALVRQYWRAPFAAVIRIICAAAVHGYLGYVFNLRRARGYTAEGSLAGPPFGRRDSLILLKAACFLDSSFGAGLHQLGHSTAAGQAADLVGALDETPLQNPDFIFWCILILATVFDILLKIVVKVSRSIRRRKGTFDDNADNGLHEAAHPILFVSYLLVLWAVCVATVGVEMASTLRSREWVKKSGWMGDKTSNEQDVRTFGQVAALATIVAVAIALLDKVNYGYENNTAGD